MRLNIRQLQHKYACLIYSTASLTHTQTHSFIHRKIYTSASFFYFNNSPSVLIVIRSFSMQPLNLKMLSKGVYTHTHTQKIAWHESACVCAHIPCLFTANYSGCVEKYKFNDFQSPLRQCCHFMYYLVIFLRGIGWLRPPQCWNESGCFNYNKNHQGTLCDVTKGKVRYSSSYKRGHSAKYPNCKMNHKNQRG